MPRRGTQRIDCRTLELDGIRYVVLRQSVFDRLCQAADVEPALPSETPDLPAAGLEGDRASLAEKLIRRRRAAGLSQAELARRAGVRPETLNRIERGRTMPDFATVRKLVIAMNAAESEHAERALSRYSRKESDYATRK
jgi:DNA-binding XRE family transcriptional regulator